MLTGKKSEDLIASSIIISSYLDLYTLVYEIKSTICDIVSNFHCSSSHSVSIDANSAKRPNLRLRLFGLIQR